jgi:antitoxin PrlF
LAKLLSKVTSKGQTTIPVSVRKKLGLKSGDLVEFKVGKGGVMLSKADRLDAAFLKLAQQTFSHWNSKEDDEAFRDL